MMKNKIVQYANKYLSLLLAIVLLASSLIIPMAVNAEPDAAAKAAAVAALKEAWIDLESKHKGTAFAYPNRTMADWNWAGDKHLQPTAIADKDYYGDYYSYVDSTDNAFKDKVARVWYGAANKGAEITGIDISTGIRFGQLRAKSGFYIYVKVEGTTEGASIKINPEYNWQKTTANDKTVTITQDGIYMIKDTDLYANGLEDIAAAVEAAAGDWNAYDRRMQRFILKFTDLNGAKVTCGSLHWKSNVSSTVPANINEMSVNELISAAENVDTALPHYISSKVDAFITALNTVKNLYMDDAELFALINAYKKLESERKGTAFAYPNRNMADWSWAGDKYLQQTAEADKDYYGDYYSYVDSTDNAFKDKVARVWYGAANVGAEITGIDISTGIRFGQLRAKSGFYIYVKVEGTTEGASIKINPEYNWQKTTANDKTVTITQDGIYMIKDTDLYANGLEDIAAAVEAAAGDWNAYDRRMQRFILKFTGLNGAKVTCGSLHWVSDQEPNIPANIDGLSVEELYSLVSSVDLSDSSYTAANVEAFRTALAAFEASHSDLLAIGELKKAWHTLRRKDGIVTMFPGAAFGTNSWIEFTQTAWATGNKYGIPISHWSDTDAASSEDATVMLGRQYSEVNTTDFSENSWVFFGMENNKGWGFNPAPAILSNKNVGFYFYVYVKSISQDVELQFLTGCNASKVDKTVTVKKEDVGKWIKLTDRDFFTNGYKTLYDKAGGAIGNAQLVFKTPGNAELYVGSMFVVPATELPQGNQNFTVSDWLTAAISLDLTQYDNTDDFEAALHTFKNLYPKEAFVAEVKNAWAAMTLDPRTIFSPAVKHSDQEVKDNMFVPTDTLSQEEQTKFGSHYATVDTGVYKRIDLTKAANGWWDSASITDYKDIVLNIRVDSVTKNDYIYAHAYTSGSRQSGGHINITKADEGKWLTLSSKELFGKSFEDVKSEVNDFRVLILYSSLKDGGDGSAVLTIGSLMGIPYVGLPEESDSWDFNKWVLETIKLDTSNYNNTEAFEACRVKALNYKETDNIMSCEMRISPAEGLDLAKFGTNVLNGIKPEITYVNGSEKAEISNKRYVNLTDGDITTAYGIEDAVYTGSSYVDVVYQVKGRAKITDLLVAAEDAAGIADYEIYVGNNKENLFIIANREVIYKKTGTDDAQVQIFSYPQKSEAWGTYIGFRFKDPTADADAEKYLRILELGAYGVVQSGSVETSDELYLLSENNLGKNILAENKLAPKVKFNGSSVNISGLKPEYLYDKSITTHCRFTNGAYQQWKVDDGSVYLDVYFDLGSLYKINNFFISHLKASWDTDKLLATGEYAIYASEDFATLFQGTSRIVTYNNRSDEKGDGSGTTYAQLFTMYGEGVIARYVSFRITMPVSNWAVASEKETGNRVGMITELGVYGEVYNKPVYDANLTPHVPLTVYRSDAKGRTEVNEAEFGSEMYGLLYDGETDEAAPVSTNGKTLDYLYNLCGSMDISAFRITTLSPQIKALKIYATLVEDRIWSENSLVYAYYNDSADSAVVEKLFTDKLKKARYVRFSVTGVNDSVFKPVEIEVIGKNNQMATYRNIVQDQDGFVNLYLVDKNTGKYGVFSHNANKVCVETRPIRNMLDADTNTLLDLYAGKNNEQTINILFALDSVSAIDNITLTAGSNSKYWPSKLNYYFGNSEKELLSSNTPAKSFVGKPEGGVYSYDFLPKQIQYIRVEIAESDNPYFAEFTDKIISVISEIAVNGMSVKGVGEGDSVASFTNAENGIKVEILRNSENDVFDRVQSIKVTKRDVSSDEKTSVFNSLGVNFSSPVYTIELLDSFGKAVTDVGEREILVRFPLSGFEDEDGVYLLQLADGSWKMLEAYAEDGYLTITLESPLNLCFALSEYKEEEITDEEPEDEEIDLDDGLFDEEDDFFEELGDDFDDDFDFEDEKVSSRRKKKVIITTAGTWLPYIIVGIAAVLVIGAGGTFIIIFIKKRKRKQ